MKLQCQFFLKPEKHISPENIISITSLDNEDYVKLKDGNKPSKKQTREET